MQLQPSVPEQSGASQSPQFEPVGPLSNDRGCVQAHRTLGLRPPHCRCTPAPLPVPPPPLPRSRIASVESSYRTIASSAAKVNGPPYRATARQRLFLSAISLPAQRKDQTCRYLCPLDVDSRS